MKRNRSKIVFDDIPGIRSKISKKIDEESKEKLDSLIEDLTNERLRQVENKSEDQIIDSLATDNAKHEEEYPLVQKKRDENSREQDGDITEPIQKSINTSRGVYTIDEYIVDNRDNKDVLKSILNLTVGGIATAGTSVVFYNILKRVSEFISNVTNHNDMQSVEIENTTDRERKRLESKEVKIDKKDEKNLVVPTLTHTTNNKYTLI